MPVLLYLGLQARLLVKNIEMKVPGKTPSKNRLKVQRESSLVDDAKEFWCNSTLIRIYQCPYFHFQKLTLAGKVSRMILCRLGPLVGGEQSTNFGFGELELRDRDPVTLEGVFSLFSLLLFCHSSFFASDCKRFSRKHNALG